MPLLQDRYSASREIITLTTSLYVAGLGCGPFVMAPIAELYGRQRAYSISMIGSSPFSSCYARSILTRRVSHRVHHHEPHLLLRRLVRAAPGQSLSHALTRSPGSLPGLIVLRLYVPPTRQVQGDTRLTQSYSLSGFFGSSGPGLGVATISDRPSAFPPSQTTRSDVSDARAVFRPQERGRPIAIYAIVRPHSFFLPSHPKLTAALLAGPDARCAARSPMCEQVARTDSRLRRPRPRLDLGQLVGFGRLSMAVPPDDDPHRSQHACRTVPHARDVRARARTRVSGKA